MKELEISEAFRAQFAADSTFTGVSCRNDLDSGTVVIPGLIFAVTTKPLNNTGTALEYQLTIWAESLAEKQADSDPEPGLVHRTLVDAVRAKLHGTGKDTLLAALNGEEVFSWRGWTANQEGNQGVEAHHFRTPLCADGVVLVL